MHLAAATDLWLREFFAEYSRSEVLYHSARQELFGPGINKRLARAFWPGLFQIAGQNDQFKEIVLFLKLS